MMDSIGMKRQHRQLFMTELRELKARRAAACHAVAKPALKRQDSGPLSPPPAYTLPPPPANALPRGWRSDIDPNTGQEFFYNKELKKTQWDRPVTPGTPARVYEAFDAAAKAAADAKVVILANIRQSACVCL